MERLALYTSIDGKIHIDTIKYRENTKFLYKIPQGSVVLHKKVLFDINNHTFSEVYIESDRDYLLRDETLVKLAFNIHNEDMVYESDFKI